MSPTEKKGPSRVNVAIKGATHKRLRITAAVRGVSVIEATETAIDKWIGKPERVSAEAAEAVSR